MAILIDAYNISRVQGTGVATYGRTLAKAATSLGHEVHLLYGTRAGHARQPLLNEIALAEGEEAAASGFRKIGITRQVATAISGIVTTRNAREINLSGEVIMPTPLGDELSGMRYWNAPRLYSLSQKAFRITGRMSNVKVCNIDIAHWTYPLPIKISGAVNIYTLHDLIPLRMPYTTSDQKKDYLSLCQSIAREADHILTVSEHSRADIIRILGVKENRVTNLYQTTDLEEILNLLTTEQIEIEIDGLLNLEMRGYYLFFGAIEPKKNIARIIEAYLTSGARHPLVIVGAPGWGSNRDLTLLKQICDHPSVLHGKDTWKEHQNTTTANE
jgi:glycosyltransferase involved in cell wall biosynthesis